ncbi:MAG: radical SAM protein [Candidatus Marinimicrobia bacterium]|nr:radical SAM protein [Candidatus Neomarinimicrobiota bacterium]
MGISEMILTKNEATKANLNLEMKDIARRLNLSDYKEGLQFPKYFQIETVRHCNAHCPFCPVDEWDKSTPFMSEELFDKIVDEIAPYSDWINFVTVQRAGEPLMDKNIAKHISKLKAAGIKKVLMSTNASLLTDKKAREILDAGLDEIMLSIDSVDKEQYEKMRVGLKYETTIKNIKNFFRLRDIINPEMLVRVRGVSFFNLTDSDQRDELERWESFWDQLRKPHDRIYMKQAHNWGNQVEWDSNIPEFDSIYHPCILPWSTMHITAMGIVPLCGQDYDALMNIGNINTTTIAEVWKNEKWTEIREKHQSGNRNDISMCRGCRLFDEEFSIEKKQLAQTA